MKKQIPGPADQLSAIKVLENKINSFLSRGNLDEAEELAFHYNFFSPLLEYYLKKGNTQDCVDFCDRFLKAAPDSTEGGSIYHTKGMMLKKLGRSREEILAALKESYHLGNIFGALSYYQELTQDEPAEMTDEKLKAEAFEVISKTYAILLKEPANLHDKIAPTQSLIFSYLGEHHHFGIGTPLDMKVAVAYYSQAINTPYTVLGKARAQYNLALIEHSATSFAESLTLTKSAEMLLRELMSDKTNFTYELAKNILTKVEVLEGLNHSNIANKYSKEIALINKKLKSEAQHTKTTKALRDTTATVIELARLEQLARSDLAASKICFQNAAVRSKNIKAAEASDNLAKTYFEQKKFDLALSYEINQAVILKHLIEQGYDQYAALYLETLHEIREAVNKGTRPAMLDKEHSSDFFMSSVENFSIMPTAHAGPLRAAMASSASQTQSFKDSINRLLSKEKLTTIALEQAVHLSGLYNIYEPFYSFLFHKGHYDKCAEFIDATISSAASPRTQDQTEVIIIAAKSYEKLGDPQKAVEFLEPLADTEIDAAIALCSIYSVAPLADFDMPRRIVATEATLKKVAKLLEEKKSQETQNELQAIATQEMMFDYYSGMLKSLQNPDNKEAGYENFKKIVQRDKDFDHIEYFRAFFWCYNFNNFPRTHPELFLQKMQELLQKMQKSTIISTDIEKMELYALTYAKIAEIYISKCEDEANSNVVRTNADEAFKNYSLALSLSILPESEADFMTQMGKCFHLKTFLTDKQGQEQKEDNFFNTLNYYISAAGKYKESLNNNQNSDTRGKQEFLFQCIETLLKQDKSLTRLVKLNAKYGQLKRALNELEDVSSRFSKIIDQMSTDLPKAAKAAATPAAAVSKPKEEKTKGKGYYEEQMDYITRLEADGTDRQEICNKLAKAILVKIKFTTPIETQKRQEAIDKISALIEEGFVPYQDDESRDKQPFGLLPRLVNKSKAAETKLTEMQDIAQQNLAAENARLKQTQAKLEKETLELQQKEAQKREEERIKQQQDEQQRQKEQLQRKEAQAKKQRDEEEKRRAEKAQRQLMEEKQQREKEQRLREQEARQQEERKRIHEAKLRRQREEQERRQQEAIKLAALKAQREQERIAQEKAQQEAQRAQEQLRAQEAQQARQRQEEILAQEELARQQRLRDLRKTHDHTKNELDDIQARLFGIANFQHAITIEAAFIELFQESCEKVREHIASHDPQNPQQCFRYYDGELNNSLFEARNHKSDLEDLKQLYEDCKPYTDKALLRLAHFHNGMWEVCGIAKDSHEVINNLAEFAYSKTTQTTSEEDAIITSLIAQNHEEAATDAFWMGSLKKDLQITLAKTIIDKLANKENCEDFLAQFYTNLSNSLITPDEISAIKINMNSSLDRKFPKFWNEDLRPSATTAHPLSTRVTTERGRE